MNANAWANLACDLRLEGIEADTERLEPAAQQARRMADIASGERLAGAFAALRAQERRSAAFHRGWRDTK